MICILSFSHLHLCRKKSYRILSFFKVIFYQKANVFLFYQHLTMKRGNYIIAHSFYKIDSFDSDCKLYVIQTEKIRRKCTICSPEQFTLQHILLPGTLWPTTHLLSRTLCPFALQTGICWVWSLWKLRRKGTQCKTVISQVFK